MVLQKNIFLGYAISSIWNGLLGALLLFGIDFYLILLAVNSPEVAKIFTPRMLVAHGSRLYVYIIYLYLYISLSLSSLASLSFSFLPLPLLQEAEAGRRHGRRGRAGQSRAGQARAWKTHGNPGRQNEDEKTIAYLLFEKCACPTFKSWISQAKFGKLMEIWDVRSRGQKYVYIYISLSLLFENMRLPNLQKARFCTQNREIHGNLGGQEPRNHLNMFYFKKCACATSKKLDFANKITETGRSGAEKPFEYVLF